MYNCSNRNLTRLPDTALNGTDWVIVTGNNLRHVTTAPEYLPTVLHLDLSRSNVTGITADVIVKTLEKAKYLNIAMNNLTQVPEEIRRSSNGTELWMSGNPYRCDCDVMWMRDWLLEATNVMDIQNVTCASGKMIGKRVSSLSEFWHKKIVMKG